MTRTTLIAVLTDPKRQEHAWYFWRVWSPDESYFQTLVRLHSAKHESQSLTFAQFDAKGKPHVFYDDHLDVLRQSQCFIARKIWPGANHLYDSLLQPHHPDAPPNSAEAVPQALTCLVAAARTLAQHGRPGLYMQSRFPLEDKRSPITAEKYTVFEGFWIFLMGLRHGLQRWRLPPIPKYTVICLRKRAQSFPGTTP